MQCHGTPKNSHPPQDLEMIDSDQEGHANVACDECGVILETSTTIAEQVT